MLRLISATYPETLDCHVVLDSMSNRALLDLFGNAGIPTHIASGPVRLLQCFNRLQPDVAYLFARIHVASVWAAVARLAGVPAIVGAERGWGREPVDWISHRLGSWFFDGYIANSRSAAKYLDKAGMPSDRVFVVYNGIDEQDGSSEDLVSEVSFGSPSILCVANILPLKGQSILLQAVRKLRPDFPGIRAVLVGKDYTDGRFMEEIASLGLAELVTWVGFDPHVHPYLQRADLFVLPSLWGEGMPTSLLEAMLAAKPVVASNTGGIVELIEDNRTGLLVTPGDADALAAQIRRVLDAPMWGRELGRAARLHVLTNFSLKGMVKGHIDAFQCLLEMANSSPRWSPAR